MEILIVLYLLVGSWIVQVSNNRVDNIIQWSLATLLAPLVGVMGVVDALVDFVKEELI